MATIYGPRPKAPARANGTSGTANNTQSARGTPNTAMTAAHPPRGSSLDAPTFTQTQAARGCSITNNAVHAQSARSTTQFTRGNFSSTAANGDQDTSSPRSRAMGSSIPRATHSSLRFNMSLEASYGSTTRSNIARAPASTAMPLTSTASISNPAPRQKQKQKQPSTPVTRYPIRGDGVDRKDWAPGSFISAETTPEENVISPTFTNFPLSTTSFSLPSVSSRSSTISTTPDRTHTTLSPVAKEMQIRARNQAILDQAARDHELACFASLNIAAEAIKAEKMKKEKEEAAAAAALASAGASPTMPMTTTPVRQVASPVAEEKKDMSSPSPRRGGGFGRYADKAKRVVGRIFSESKKEEKEEEKKEEKVKEMQQVSDPLPLIFPVLSRSGSLPERGGLSGLVGMGGEKWDLGGGEEEEDEDWGEIPIMLHESCLPFVGGGEMEEMEGSGQGMLFSRRPSSSASDFSLPCVRAFSASSGGGGGGCGGEGGGGGMEGMGLEERLAEAMVEEDEGVDSGVEMGGGGKEGGGVSGKGKGEEEWEEEDDELWGDEDWVEVKKE